MTERASAPAGLPTGPKGAPLRHGSDRIPLDGRRPKLLDDAALALQVIAGHVDLFALPIKGDATAAAARRHLWRIEVGGIILALPFVNAKEPGKRIAALVVGAQGAEALAMDRSLIEDPKLIDGWIAQLSAALAETPSEWNAREAERGTKFTLEAGAQIRAPAHGIAWVAVESGEIALMGCKSACRAGDAPLPLASGTWGLAAGETSVRVLDREVGADPWHALDRFHELAMECIAEGIEKARGAEINRFGQRAERAAAQGQQLIEELSTVMTPRRGTDLRTQGMDPLLDACHVAAQALGARIVSPSVRGRSPRGVAEVAAIAHASRLQSRRVLLRRGWWQSDVGPLIAWRGEVHEPVAIVPVAPGRHLTIDAGTGRARRVDAAVAAQMNPEAVMFYAPPPLLGGAVTLFGFCLRQVFGDFGRILLSAMAIGALSLATPLIVEVLIDSIIPRTEFDQLAYCAAGLAMVAIGIAGFQAVQSVGTLRLEGALDRTLQAGVVDRLLRLPVSFFRRYAAGDLTDRVLGIDAIRRIATGHTIRGLLAIVFASLSFVLMFYYDASIALIAATVTLVRGAMIVTASAARLKRERLHFELDGKAQGLVLQLITGVGKLRVAFAVERALTFWACKFADQKKQFVASQRVGNLLGVFEAGFPTIATLAIFAGAGHATGEFALDTGQFLAFFVAFGQSIAAVGDLAAAIGATLIAVPRFDRIRPLIAEPAEIVDNRNPPGDLVGALEFRQVTFRYAPGGPVILNKVTMQVRKGEYVAVVGPSGSGKSTLFRLLLGFEKSESGTVLFDGKAIDTLDVTAIRRQIGVVLQNGKLASGSIYENICCGAALSMEQAREAARLAGLDADIEAMPMGMHTVIAEGLDTLSGGQRQRLMIARALVHHPRILLFDEATSALDNRTQAIVSNSLAKLNVTRVVIAQRLSTVRSADRIIVLAGGEIIQSGSFGELAVAPGMFAEFAKRQLL